MLLDADPLHLERQLFAFRIHDLDALSDHLVRARPGRSPAKKASASGGASAPGHAGRGKRGPGSLCGPVLEGHQRPRFVDAGLDAHGRVGHGSERGHERLDVLVRVNVDVY